MRRPKTSRSKVILEAVAVEVLVFLFDPFAASKDCSLLAGLSRIQVTVPFGDKCRPKLLVLSQTQDVCP